MRAVARVVGWAALVGLAILIGLRAPAASAAHTPLDDDRFPASSDPSLFVVRFDTTRSLGSFSETGSPTLLRSDNLLAPAEPNPIFPEASADEQSPIIDLPPAVSSGLGLLALLAGCMMLRRFAYRPILLRRK